MLNTPHIEESIQPLLDKLAYTGADELRFQAEIDKAIDALAQSGDPTALAALIDYFGTTSAKPFKRRILSAIGGLYDGLVLNFLIDTASHDDLDLREMAISRLLGWFPYERVVDPLFAALGVLKRQGVWYQIVATFVESGDHDLIRRLRSGLTAEEAAYRCAAVVAIRLINPPELAPVMLVLLRNDVDADIRSRAAQALADAHHPQIVDAFIGALTDPEYAVRSAAYYGLIRQGDTRGVEALQARCDQLAADPQATRHELMELFGAMSALSGAEPIDTLISLVQNPDLHIRVHAAAVDRLSLLPPDQLAAAEAQVREVIPMLAAMLEDESRSKMHYGILQLVTAMKAPEAVEPICHMLITNLAHKLAHYMIHALAEIADARAVPTLIMALGQNDLDDMILRALKRIGTADALAAVESYNARAQSE